MKYFESFNQPPVDKKEKKVVEKGKKQEQERWYKELENKDFISQEEEMVIKEMNRALGEKAQEEGYESIHDFFEAHPEAKKQLQALVMTIIVTSMFAGCSSMDSRRFTRDFLRDTTRGVSRVIQKGARDSGRKERILTRAEADIARISDEINTKLQELLELKSKVKTGTNYAEIKELDKKIEKMKDEKFNIEEQAIKTDDKKLQEGVRRLEKMIRLYEKRRMDKGGGRGRGRQSTEERQIERLEKEIARLDQRRTDIAQRADFRLSDIDMAQQQRIIDLGINIGLNVIDEGLRSYERRGGRGRR